MQLSFRNKVLFTIALSCLVCVSAATINSRLRIKEQGEKDLVEKARAILSRLEAGREYVAQQGILDLVVANATQAYPDGKLPEEERLKVLRSVPIYASLVLGEKNSEADHYKFRVFTENPRNKDNTATPSEKKLIAQFKNDNNLKEIVSKTEDEKFIMVSRPVRISKAQGCLTCHGKPSKSPWGNGKDVLGYEMEDWKDGQLHGAMAVVSDMKPVVASTQEATIAIILWGGVFTLIALLVGFLIIRKPINVLSSVSSQLGQAGVEVSSASNQLSGVSQSLSSSANEAAASLEHTVSSLEELSSMVSRNSENAKEAAALSLASRGSAEKGEKEITELITAMNEIAGSSKKVEDIINVIDDIAFQTNLLALNAAVEAARAGDQGKGFAVVAEAVRNLAQRSAEAAKEITELIKESGQKVERGSGIADASGAVLNEIVNSVKKVADLNNEISEASSEQSIGLNQISSAMNQLDKVTQQNAASSEEAAASAEEMSAQAKAVQDMVARLHIVISGDSHGRTTSRSEIPVSRRGGLESVSQENHKNVIDFASKQAKAADVIPFDEDLPGTNGSSGRGVGTTDGF